jgi:hypothetical protein
MKKLVITMLLVFGGIAAAQGTAPAPEKHPTDPHQICRDMLNSDPEFAKSIVETADKQIDQKTLDAQREYLHHIQKNERHVIYAYAAMWALAALLLMFLWKRQQALKVEIATLRRDLAKAESDT